MNAPLGYRIVEEIERHGGILVLRSIRKADHKQVLLKTTIEKIGTSKDRAALRHEYNLLRDLDIPGAVQPLSLEEYQDRLVVVFEDPGGGSLKNMIKSGFHLAGGLSLRDFLMAAMSMATTIERLHRKKIIHKDLGSHNILLDPHSLQSRLTGFYRASKLPREEPRPLSGTLEGAWQYISPEQTGRMNRTVDLRSDLYSLGVMLYELAAGRLPFTAADPLEWIHFHLARQPVPPYEINPGLPLVISDMILKLMAKEAEQRYQSASGLIADLEECFKRLETSGWIDDFAVGRFDFPYPLKIPEKLYGRGRELSLLSRRFENVFQGSKELILVSGEAGIGKTSIVNEIYKLVPYKKGFYLSGKFDQLKRNIPYSALVNAFSALARQLLTESPHNLTLWKEKIITALGANGRIIINVIPEMEMVIGPQPPVEELGPIESQNRFNYVFQRFIRVFGQAEHPLVVFLDDLQWADTATFKLIHSMMADEETRYLLLIGAYRQNEVTQTHPLPNTLEVLASEGIPLKKIFLGPLELEDINQLTSETLKLDKSQLRLLARTVLEKTNGNPFFVARFFNAMSQEDLLTFDVQERRWKWDLDTIQKMDATENVVNLLIRSLQRLEADTLEAIKIGACLGTGFDLAVLDMIMEKGQGRLLQDLLPAVENGLLISSYDYRFVEDDHSSDRIITFKFLHDRIQQAAVALIDKDRRQEIHLRLGRFKLSNIDAEDLDDEVFEIVHHLNMSAGLIRERGERYRVAELNLIAGRQARHSAAFEYAFQYARSGLALLDPDSWTTHYDLTLALYTEALQTAYLNVDLDEIDTLFEHVILNAGNLLDRVGAYKSRIQAYMAQNRLLEAMDTGLEILGLLGVDFPEHADGSDIQTVLEEIQSLLQSKKIEDLLHLPGMTDPDKTATVGLLAEIGTPIYFSRPRLLPLIISKAVTLSILHGNLPESSFFYSVYGLMLCGLSKDIDTGYQFGKLGMELAEKTGAKEFQCKTIEIFNLHIRHYKEHVRETLDPLLTGYRSGVETGDLQFANFCAYARCAHAYLIGRDLSWVEEEMAGFSQAIKQHRQVTVLHLHSIFQQAVLNLRAKNGDPYVLVGEAYNERIMLARHQQANDRHALNYFYFNKMILAFLFEEYDRALEYTQAAERYLDGVIALLVVPVFHFYDSLIRLAVYPKVSHEKKEEILRKVSRNQEKMKAWSDHAPMNYLHKYHLVEAEHLRILGRDMDALEHYDLAIAMAQANGYINENALAGELAAKFWLSKGKGDLAGPYLQKARHGYAAWGAIRKVVHLEKEYNRFLRGPDLTFSDVARGTIPMAEVPAQPGLDGVDLATIIKASQAVSGEILLDRLINIFMKILMENVGAQKGLLVLKSNDRWVVEAHSEQGEDFVLFRPGLPVEDYRDLAAEVVNFVLRTGESVVLDDAFRQGLFTEDPYVRSKKSKSILCAPIIHKTQATGIIYLENNLAAGAFTIERLEMINVLATQIAISIENAVLYADLKTTEEKYRGIFENAVEGIYQTTPDGKFISINPAMARLLGYDSPEELMETVNDIGQQLYVNQGDREEFLDLIHNNQAVSGFEVRFRRKDGSIIWASLHARTVREENGDIRFIEGFFVDITERKQAAQALRDREEYLRKENIRLRSNIKDRYRFGNIVGKSPAMQEVYELILNAAASDAPVVIYGESGTGKELVARAIHQMSDRKNAPFVPVNCGAIPENLLESEFFGYKRGAFTGAHLDKEGFLDLADRGALFLDELGEIGLNLQVKLLRALEGRGFTPLGGRKVKRPDFRIIAATSLDLKHLVIKGRMREDFFYRVHIIPIHLPPLRERREDIPLLIEYFWKAHGYEKTQPLLPAQVISLMLGYEWPGNVRELENALHRYVALNRLDFLGGAGSGKQSAGPDKLNMETLDSPLREAVAEFEKSYIADLLDRHQWHRTRVASILGIGRRTLFRKMASYGLNKTRNR